MVKRSNLAIFLLIALSILFFLLSIALTNQADAQGCLPQKTITLANDAGYRILYNQRGQMDAINDAILSAYETKAPDQYLLHLLIAKRYWKQHPRLSAYHLIKASQNPCY